MTTTHGDGRRILVVDDEADLVATYTRLLSRVGFRVVSAPTRRDGLTVLEREPIALAIVDLHLPDGHGLDLVRAAAIRPTPVPIIVATGFSSSATRAAALEAGAAAYFAKPFSATRLLEAIQTVVAAPLRGAVGPQSSARPTL